MYTRPLVYVNVHTYMTLQLDCEYSLFFDENMRIKFSVLLYPSILDNMFWVLYVSDVQQKYITLS
jgi:hypothetical protein